MVHSFSYRFFNGETVNENLLVKLRISNLRIEHSPQYFAHVFLAYDCRPQIPAVRLATSQSINTSWHAFGLVELVP